jgi:hypothetical protein
MNNLNLSFGDKDNDGFKMPAAATEILLKKDPLLKVVEETGSDIRGFIILMQFINKFLKDTEESMDKLRALSLDDSILHHMKEFKDLINSLKEQDQSQKIDYALKLSKTWHLIVDYFTLLPKMDRKGDFFHDGSLLIQSINIYPQDEDRTLGFYLSNYAGENWLPFPYMKIIQKLHEEHASDPAGSHLEIWSKTLVKLIEIFTQRILSSPQVG